MNSYSKLLEQSDLTTEELNAILDLLSRLQMIETKAEEDLLEQLEFVQILLEEARKRCNELSRAMQLHGSSLTAWRLFEIYDQNFSELQELHAEIYARIHDELMDCD